jgi:hypothetical protein
MANAIRIDPIREVVIALSVLVVVVMAAMWARGGLSLPSPVQTAAAATAPQGADGPGVPDSGRQFLIMVEELRALNGHVKALNERLNAIDRSLRDGEYKVKATQGNGKAEGGQ